MSGSVLSASSVREAPAHPGGHDACTTGQFLAYTKFANLMALLRLSALGPPKPSAIQDPVSFTIKKTLHRILYRVRFHASSAEFSGIADVRQDRPHHARRACAGLQEREERGESMFMQAPLFQHSRKCYNS
jgi:hypothetical protein